eukprot:TRINITY_DN2100_c0_g1_i1.p2 TRINITY_DN2100_c0_g1~~TRINITY_DN2100_c0_g1_i1.p2  ORF type:complete len:128 (+),score=18.03 TRINITY_DN2100_c0_g1_i1:106-489(+)
MSPLPSQRMQIPGPPDPSQCCYLFAQCNSIGYCVSKRTQKAMSAQKCILQPVVPEYGSSPFPDATVMKTPSKSKGPQNASLESLAEAIDAYKSGSTSVGDAMEDLARLESIFEKRTERRKRKSTELT